MKRLMLALGAMVCAAGAQADVYGLVNGRTADLLSEPQMTVEGGLSLEGDLTTIGAQVNYKTAPNMLVYGSIASVDPDYAGAEIGFGGGAVYQFDQSVLVGFDTAIKGSYHMVDFGGGNASVDLSDLGVEILISPQEQNVSTGMKLFGMVGFHRISVDTNFGDDSNTELAFGGGALFKVGMGEAYGVVEHIDELFFGFGYRMALGQ